MTSPQLARSFAASVEHVLGAAPGTLLRASGPEFLPSIGAQLAARNLGLVRVRDPERFAWPGPWIAIREAATATHLAAVMFGVPSGVVYEPPDLLAGDDAVVVDGFVIAPLDLLRSVGTEAYADHVSEGFVVGLYVAAERNAACTSVEAAEAVAGRGLVGDRYADGAGTFSARGRTGLALTLIEVEALEALAVHSRIDLPAAEARRNVVTRDIRLDALIGRRFRIGTVTCFGARRAEPCAHLQRLTRDGVLRGLVHRGGLRVDILSGGTIRRGDRIRVLDPKV